MDYISNPKRQEHLYAVYSTVEPQFWQELAEQNQYDFKRYQTKGQCIEARELVIALPESLTDRDPELLLKLFTETFRSKYGVQCTAALHHNKAMTNYHIHLIFSERGLLEKKSVKRASRNMFYDEQWRHVRTKKEILDEAGNIREGCHIIPKGEIYDMNYFGPKNPQFKSRKFVHEVKVRYTDLINQILGDKEEHLTVFDPTGPYLPTKKIGKHNPKEAEIRADNQVRKQWNRAVEQAMIEGVPEAELLEFKKTEITEKVRASIQENGSNPDQLAGIIQVALMLLKKLIQMIMERAGETVSETGTLKEGKPAAQMPEPTVSQKPAAEDKASEVSAAVPEDMGQKKVRGAKGVSQDKPGRRAEKNTDSLRPSSEKEEAEFTKMSLIHEHLRKISKRIYAREKKIETAQFALDATPTDIFHKKDRSELKNRIEDLKNKIEGDGDEMDRFAHSSGFQSVRDAENAYWRAKHELEIVHQEQNLWDGKPISPDKPKSTLAELKYRADKMMQEESCSNSSRHKKEQER